MALSDDLLIRWYTEGVDRFASFMLVYRDNFTRRFFPVYVRRERDVPAVRRLYRGQYMYRCCMVVDLGGDMSHELELGYEWNPPEALIR